MKKIIATLSIVVTTAIASLSNAQWPSSDSYRSDQSGHYSYYQGHYTSNLNSQCKANEPTRESHLSAINAVRARYGLAALVSDPRLEEGARYQANYCARVGRLQHASGVAEILAQNRQGLETAISQWLNSPGHRALLLNGSFRYAGVAVVRDHYGRFWCAVQFR